MTRKLYHKDLWAQVPPIDDEVIDPVLIASMAPDGTDRQLEHIFGTPEGIIRSGTGGGMRFLAPDFALETCRYLAEDGSYDSWLTVVDQDGEYTLFQNNQEEFPRCRLWRSLTNFGDSAFFSSVMDPDMTTVYRLENRELTSVDLSGLPTDGAYLSGDTLRIFRPGDGYYDVDLNTREEIKLADNQLENSRALIVLPNCIFESTLMGLPSCAIRAEVDKHSLRYFDGAQWWDIAIPQQLEEMNADSYLGYMAVASDRILFLYCEKAEEIQIYPYQMLLGTDNPTLEPIGCWNLFFNPHIYD